MWLKSLKHDSLQDLTDCWGDQTLFGGARKTINCLGLLDFFKTLATINLTEFISINELSCITKGFTPLPTEPVSHGGQKDAED